MIHVNEKSLNDVLVVIKLGGNYCEVITGKRVAIYRTSRLHDPGHSRGRRAMIYDRRS